jgi:hypothetical protein
MWSNVLDAFTARIRTWLGLTETHEQRAVERRLNDQRTRLERIDAAIDVTRARHNRRSTDRP